jgi:Cu(I)/Ag(I) efflux system periplasmic protein CusF
VKQVTKRKEAMHAMQRTAVLSMTALLLALGAAPPAAFAQSSDSVIGQVTKIEAEKITIKHGPIKKFGMDERMTMVFHALDPQLLKKVKSGDKVRFVPDRIDGQFTVTQIEKIK